MNTPIKNEHLFAPSAFNLIRINLRLRKISQEAKPSILTVFSGKGQCRPGIQLAILRIFRMIERMSDVWIFVKKNPSVRGNARVNPPKEEVEETIDTKNSDVKNISVEQLKLL